MQVLFLISLFLLTSFSSHAAESNHAAPRRNWVELSVGAARSLSGLEDGGKHTQLSHQDSLSGRALVVVLPWFSVGAEGTWFEKEKDIPFVSGYKERRSGIVGKFTLTPDTQPKVYLLTGAGKTKREFTYTFALTETAKTNYFLAAIGLEASIWKGIFLAAEGYGVYNAHTHVSRFFRQKHRFEPGLSVRAGIRF